MNYTKIYNNIIEQAKNRVIDGYSERHHILPKSLGGNNKKCNIVKLTAREHFICHWLLIKIYASGKEHINMLLALNMMKVYHEEHNRYIKHSKIFEQAKEKLYGEFGLMRGENSPRFGKITSKETREKQSDARKKMFKNNPEELQRVINLSKNRTKEHQDKINKANTGQKRTKKSRKLMSEVHIGLQSGENNAMSKKISIDDVYYPSIGEAARQTGIKNGTIGYRVKSKNFTSYFYI